MSFSSDFGPSNPFNPGGRGFGGNLERDLEKVRGSLSESSHKPGVSVSQPATSLHESYDEIYRAILKRLAAFEEQLPQSEEVAMRVASFGGPLTLRVDDLTHHRPGLIVFYGRDENGKTVELVQHASQLSFLLTGAQRDNPQTSRPEKGFHRAVRDMFESLAQTPDQPPPDDPSPEQSPE